jgi:Protein of unknown function (DUF3788)
VASSAFGDRSVVPDDEAVATALGPAYWRWVALLAGLARELDPVAEDWTFSGKAYGWALRVRHRGRAVVYLTPLDGGLRASLALPDRAMPAALTAGLPPTVTAILAEAPAYPEGRAVRIEVASDDDVRSVVALACIRMAS